MKEAAILLVTLALLADEQAPGQVRYSVESLSWIAGCWEGGKKNVYHEQWMKPSGKMMIGMARTVAGGKTTTYEFMRLHEDNNGDVFYTALPSGQSETTFKLISMDDTTAVFENPEHDFPQRIIYSLRLNGSLVARIEGQSNGMERHSEFPMSRVTCE